MMNGYQHLGLDERRQIYQLAATGRSVHQIAASLQRHRSIMYRELERLTRRVMESARVEPICRQLMTIPGVGPMTALAFRATVDQPERFRQSRDVGAHLGLTPRRYQSGETDVQGRVSADMATNLVYEAAHMLLTRSKKWSALKAWGTNVAKRREIAKAPYAVALTPTRAHVSLR